MIEAVAALAVAAANSFEHFHARLDSNRVIQRFVNVYHLVVWQVKVEGEMVSFRWYGFFDFSTFGDKNEYFVYFFPSIVLRNGFRVIIGIGMLSMIYLVNLLQFEAL